MTVGYACAFAYDHDHKIAYNFARGVVRRTAFQDADRAQELPGARAPQPASHRQLLLQLSFSWSSSA